jgi:hypothetical protein
MNTLLSPDAQTALKRIRTLREITRKTGFQTTDEQFRLLIALPDTDALAVVDLIGRDRKEVTR